MLQLLEPLFSVTLLLPKHILEPLPLEFSLALFLRFLSFLLQFFPKIVLGRPETSVFLHSGLFSSVFIFAGPIFIPLLTDPSGATDCAIQRFNRTIDPLTV